MDDMTVSKIYRMTRLARPFLWNLCPEVYSRSSKKKVEHFFEGTIERPNDCMAENTKPATYIWLTQNNFKVNEKDTYEIWAKDICDEGVEQVFKRLIIPQLQWRVGSETLNDLRQSWMKSEIPNRMFVKEHDKEYNKNLQKNAASVLDIHFRFGYVHRFGPLAPIIFEDASEWLEDKGLLKKSS